MLFKENRLKKTKDFENVFKNGKGYKEDFLYLKILKNDLKNSRFGFVVGKNFSKKAVLRNKMRRKLRELVKNNISQIDTSIDGILMVRPASQLADFKSLDKKIENLFKKSGVIKK